MIQALQKGQTESPIPRLALKSREAAEALGVSERTLASWVAEGRVPVVRVGGRVLFAVDALRQWLADEATKPTGRVAGQTAETT